MSSTGSTREGRTIVLITHEDDVAARAKRVDPARGRPIVSTSAGSRHGVAASPADASPASWSGA